MKVYGFYKDLLSILAYPSGPAKMNQLVKYTRADFFCVEGVTKKGPPQRVVRSKQRVEGVGPPPTPETPNFDINGKAYMLASLP